MTPIGEYTIISGERLDSGKFDVLLEKKEDLGVSRLNLILPPGSVVRIGETFEVSSLGYIPTPNS